MDKKRNRNSGLRGFLPAALVTFGWVCFIVGNAVALPVFCKLVLLVTARVLP
jgi:hypothetical protein